MNVIELGMLILVNPVHSKNAELAIPKTEFGMIVI